MYNTLTHKYVVIEEGELTVSLESGEHRLHTGDSMCFEVKAPYRFINEGAGPAPT